MFPEHQKELERLTKLIESDCDENEICILNEFPYRVILESPIADKRYDGFLDWLDENVGNKNYYRIWVSRIYFKHEEDAVAFKIFWT